MRKRAVDLGGSAVDDDVEEVWRGCRIRRLVLYGRVEGPGKGGEAGWKRRDGILRGRGRKKTRTTTLDDGWGP